MLELDQFGDNVASTLLRQLIIVQAYQSKILTGKDTKKNLDASISASAALYNLSMAVSELNNSGFNIDSDLLNNYLRKLDLENSLNSLRDD